jgi:tetratricopeptide (TPR) repeat protein
VNAGVAHSVQVEQAAPSGTIGRHMPAPLFDLVLLGYRNDLARERVLVYLRNLPQSQGGPIAVGRDQVLPVVLLEGIDHDTGLRLLSRLRDQGAQVRLAPNVDDAAAAVEPPATPPPPPTRRRAADTMGRLLTLLTLCGLAAAAYLRIVPLPRPLPPPSSEADYAPPQSLFPAQLDPAPHRLNDEAVALNNAGEFADAAGKLREAMQQAPDEEALRRNLKTVLHNWAVADLNANRTDDAVHLLEEGLALDEDVNLLSALGIARVRQEQWDAARTALERAVALGASDPYTLIALGKVYRQQGERQAAVEMFDRARDSGAGGPEFQQTLARMERELDAEWDFSEMRSPHFQIAFSGGERESNAAAQAVAQGLEDAYFHVGRKLDLFPSERVPVVLYPTEDFHDITQTPSWTGGIYDGRIKLPSRGVEDGDGAVLERTLRHEYGHVLVNQLSRGRAPVWLNEGVAIWCEEERDGDREEWADQTLSGQVLFPLRALEGSFTRLPADRVHIAYAQSYLVVRRLVAGSSGRDVRELLAGLGDGKSLEDAFRKIYSRTLASFESEFIAQLTNG